MDTIIRIRSAGGAFLTAIVFAASASARAQISVSPDPIVLTSEARTQEIVISNSGPLPLRVSAGIGLLILRTDSAGNERLDSAASADERRRSCAEWVKIYPQQFVLAPHHARTIRLFATPPAGLPDGEYVGRLIVASAEPQEGRRDSADTTSAGITGGNTNMQFKMNAILQVAYRKGAVATGLDLEGASVIRNGEETFVVADLHPLGNGTYRGMLSVILRSAEGLCLDSSAVPCQVEIADLRRRVPLKNIPVGRYRLTVESNQERPVSPGGRIIPAVPLRRTYDLVATERGITLAEREF